MAFPTRTPQILFGLLLGACLVTSPPAAAQSASPPADSTVAADSSTARAPEPYATSRSLGYHVLATPAYILHGLTRPLGWAARYAERRFPDLFKPRRPPRGVLPIVELGGPIGFLAGLALYDNHLFGSTHSARIEGLYGGPDTFEGNASYSVPAPIGAGSHLNLVANVFSNPESEFYLGGNSSDRTADDASFSRDQLDVTAGLQSTLPGSPLRGAVDLLYEHVETSGEDAQLRDASPPGLGTVDLLTSRLTLGADYTGAPPRVSRGTEVILQLDYTHDLTSDRFRYGRYVVEVRQYLPVGVFPDSRRLALRGRLEQVEPLFEGSAVPFYQLPNLGGQSSLRGFQSRRFQNDGALMLNAEYRYPIWSNLDALFFVDAGQVFNEVGEIRGERFHWSYGGGLHLLNRKGLSARFEVAGSTAGIRTILTVDPSFRRVAR
jgi:outer membrane protein assembly factor BamA